MKLDGIRFATVSGADTGIGPARFVRILDEKIPLQIWFGDVHDSSSYKFQYYRTPFNSLADLARLLEYDPQDLLCEAEERLRYKLHVEASCCYEDDRDG